MGNRSLKVNFIKMSFIETHSGKKKMYYEGYFYLTDKETFNTTYWKCEDFNKKCRGRIISRNGELKCKDSHNHPGRPEKLEALSIMENIKKKQKRHMIIRM